MIGNYLESLVMETQKVRAGRETVRYDALLSQAACPPGESPHAAFLREELEVNFQEEVASSEGVVMTAICKE